MNFDNDVSIAAAENGGFIVMCREALPDKKATNTLMIGEMKPYVAKDIGGVIKLLKEKLPEYSKMATKEEHDDSMEDEVGGKPAIGKKY